MIVFPQYWLLAQPVYFSLFAALFLIAAAEIQFFVSKGGAPTASARSSRKDVKRSNRANLR